MIKVTIRDMPLEEYVQLGYRTINYYGTDYRIMCPVSIDIEVDFVTTTKDFKWWGIKRGESMSYAVPIIALVSTDSEVNKVDKKTRRLLTDISFRQVKYIVDTAEEKKDLSYATTEYSYIGTDNMTDAQLILHCRQQNEQFISFITDRHINR